MIKQIDKDLWKITEKDFEAVVDTKWLLIYLNWVEIWNTDKQ